MSKWHNPVSTWLPLRDLRAASLTVLCYQTKSAPMRSPCVLHSPRLAISRSPSLPRIPASLLRRLSSPRLCSQTRRPNICLQLVLRRPAAGPGPAGGGDVRCGGAASGLHSLQLDPRLRPARRQPAVNPPSASSPPVPPTPPRTRPSRRRHHVELLRKVRQGRHQDQGETRLTAAVPPPEPHPRPRAR